MSFFPREASIPPKLGEYSYFDSRIKNTPHFIVTTNILQKQGCGCMYSLSYLINNNSYVHSYGIITKILDRIYPLLNKIG